MRWHMTVEFLIASMDYRHPERIKYLLHGRKFTPTPKFLSIFCLPYRPNFSDIFDLCLNWVSIEIISMSNENQLYYSFWEFSWNTHLEISSVKILLTYLLTFAVAWSYYVIYFITKMNSCLHSRTDSHLRLGFMGHQTRELLHSTPFTTPQWFQNSF